MTNWGDRTQHSDTKPREILLRFLAQAPRDRQTLDQLLQATQNTIHNKNQEYHGAEAFQESNTSIWNFVQEDIL